MYTSAIEHNISVEFKVKYSVLISTAATFTTRDQLTVAILTIQLSGLDTVLLLAAAAAAVCVRVCVCAVQVCQSISLEVCPLLQVCRVAD